MTGNEIIFFSEESMLITDKYTFIFSKANSKTFNPNFFLTNQKKYIIIFI